MMLSDMMERHSMKSQLLQPLKSYILQFASLYHRYQVENEGLRNVRYRIHSTLADYQKKSDDTARYY